MRDHADHVGKGGSQQWGGTSEGNVLDSLDEPANLSWWFPPSSASSRVKSLTLKAQREAFLWLLGQTLLGVGPQSRRRLSACIA